MTVEEKGISEILWLHPLIGQQCDGTNRLGNYPFMYRITLMVYEVYLPLIKLYQFSQIKKKQVNL